jgi:hypothetical protein
LGSIETVATSIDNRGRIAGWYLDDNNVAHGFVRAATGKIKTFDPPGSIYTLASGIDSGAITGSYLDSGGAGHGYLRSPYL